MTWGQPPFYAHQMIHQAWQPQAVAVTSDAPQLAIEPRFSAQTSADGKALVVRYVNNGAAQTLAQDPRQRYGRRARGDSKAQMLRKRRPHSCEHTGRACEGSAGGDNTADVEPGEARCTEAVFHHRRDGNGVENQ